MDPQIIDLYDEYTHRPLPRREFLRRLSGLAGGTAAALALLSLLESGTAKAALLPATDPRLEFAGLAEYASPGGPVRAYLARPAGNAGRLPGVLVIHENRGLNAHIEDVTRRLAVEGFVALAPDCLSPLGGTPADEDAARERIGNLDRAGTLATLRAGLAFLQRHPSASGKAGAVGFCWGGGQVGELAVEAPELGAAVVYYGRQPKDGIAQIRAPLLLHYAGLDTRINEGIAPFEQALRAEHKRYTVHIYDKVNHAFNNDTSEARYAAAAAKLAWERTVAFLEENLGYVNN